MSVIDKVFDKFFDKSWILTCLSIVLGSLTYFFIPTDFVEDLVFDKYDWNVAFVLVNLWLIFFLGLALIRFVYRKIISLINRNRKDAYLQREKAEEDKENMEFIKSFIDKLSDFDYSVIMYLMDNKNTVPYKQSSFFSGGHSVLNLSGWFVCSPYADSGTLSVSHTFYQYLLTTDKYNELKDILDQTGSLSHFDRKRVEI